MLLYNHRKEFVGVDGDSLEGLGFNNIADLQNESHDFADLFVKKPGYIHNFKNFSWIDFILHSETDDSKAVIHAKGKNYSCTLHVTPFHFSAEESGFCVIIKGLRALKGSEDLSASQDLAAAEGIQAPPAVEAPAAKAPVKAPAPQKPQEQEFDISLEDLQIPQSEDNLELELEPEPSLPNFEESYTQELTEPDPLDIPDSQDYDLGLMPTENEFGAPLDINLDEPLDIEDDLMMDDAALDSLILEEPTIEEEPNFELPEDVAPSKEEAPMLGDYVSPAGGGSEHLSELVRSGTYVYDPQIAADELGLPVDLIEEFIGDFIDQAHEFHDDLFASVKTGDYDNVQILSHKLKGVAANLRVEDGFDVLGVVNSSKDTEVVLPNLEQFYKIIAKLEGKELPEEAPAAVAPEPAPVIDIKQPEDGPILIDEDVSPLDNDDDLYGDLLVSEDDLVQESAPEPVSAAPVDDDLYGDLLGTPDDFNEPEAYTPPPVSESIEEDDLYGDLLAEPENVYTPEVAATPTVDVPTLNIDENRTANELGIPVDIVKDFIQDFKQQVGTHKLDFDKAIESQDIKRVNQTATLLKGMSDNLRLNEVSEVLKQLQQENNINNTAQAIATLQAYADQL